MLPNHDPGLLKISITIPEPCSEDWNNMTKAEQGRHCDKCCKVVVDFTSMPTADVIQFISSRSSEKICGRFRTDQVSQAPAFPKQNRTVTGRAKVFLAALVLVFGSALFTGCGPQGHAVGEIEATEQGTKNLTAIDSPEIETLIGDSVMPEPAPVKMGKVKYVDPKDPKQCKTPDDATIPSMLGGPVMVRDTNR